MQPFCERQFSRRSQELVRTARRSDCSQIPSARFSDRLQSSEQRILRKVTFDYQHQSEMLATHARKVPQNVYYSFTESIQNKLSFLSRTTHDREPFLQETEKTFSGKLLLAVTGKTTHTEEQRLLFYLPLKNGGLNILSPDDCAGYY